MDQLKIILVAEEAHLVVLKLLVLKEKVEQVAETIADKMELLSLDIDIRRINYDLFL
jgi:hypothetical protein